MVDVEVAHPQRLPRPRLQGRRFLGTGDAVAIATWAVSGALKLIGVVAVPFERNYVRL
jgi:hypothetical protein